MTRRQTLILVAASAILTGLVMAGFLIFTVFTFGNALVAEDPEIAAMKRVEVVRAKATIEAGERLTADKVSVEEDYERYLPPNAMLAAEAHRFYGATANTRMVKGSLIMKFHLDARTVTPRGNPSGTHGDRAAP